MNQSVILLGRFQRCAAISVALGMSLYSNTKPEIPSCDGAKSIFTWPELEKGVKERMKHEKELQVVSTNARQRIGELHKLYESGKAAKTEFETRFETLRKEIVDRAEMIVWGATGREAFLRQNGCVKINAQAIQAIRALNIGVVEIGAGAGHWAKALKDSGVDIIAYDSMETLAQPQEPFQFPVKQGDLSRLPSHRDRALLLVYPPPGPMAERCVEIYKGPVVIYCGEGRRGCNGNDRLFDLLENNYECQKVVSEFEHFGDKSFERMWIMRRKS